MKSKLTEYLQNHNKEAFYNQHYMVENPHFMLGVYQSLLESLVDLVGDDVALSLSEARDILAERNSVAWDQIKKGVSA